MNSPTVSTAWLFDNMDDPNLIILEVHQESNKAGLSYDYKGSIRGAIQVDMKADFSDASGKYPNTFPTKKSFESTCDRLGIRNNTKVVIVDRLGIYTSPRIWYVFKAMGHADVYILDGGLPAWVIDGYGTSDDLPNLAPNKGYKASLNRALIKYIEDVQNNIDSGDCLLIDARSAGRFLGTSPEPRKGLKSGSIPNSVNIPFKKLLDNWRYKTKDELRLIFKEANVENRPLVFSCGSGVTACIVMIAAKVALQNDLSVYDGSWTEWASETLQ